MSAAPGKGSMGQRGTRLLSRPRDLAREDVRDMLPPEEEERFDNWLKAQSDVATFSSILTTSGPKPGVICTDAYPAFAPYHIAMRSRSRSVAKEN